MRLPTDAQCPKKEEKKLHPNYSARVNEQTEIEIEQENLLLFSGLHPGRSYEEPRFYNHKKSNIILQYLFVTRVWSPELDKWLRR